MIGLVFLWSRLLPRRRFIYAARLTTGRFLCRPSYSFPASISPISSIDIYDKSLYEAEESANKFETELIQAITGLPNIQWRHRNIARTGFAIYGFINHYPDFIVRTSSGKIDIIETKGSSSSESSPCSSVFAPSATKMQETSNKNTRRERLFIRKSALSAILSCGFAAGMC